MKTILINGINSKTGGGKSILINYLKLLKNQNENFYYFISPEDSEFKKYETSYIKLIKIPALFKTNLLIIFTYYFLLKIIIKLKKIDLIFNHGDLIVPTNVTQLYLFDWPYAIYPESVVWNKMDLKSKIIRKIKLFFFKKEINKPKSIICQTKTAEARIQKIYRVYNTEIVPNAVSLDNLKEKNLDYNFEEIDDKNYNMLYLTYYYPHKNIESLLGVAKLIIKNNLKIKIFITISADQGNGAKELLENINNNNLNKIIINLGPVSMTNVPSLYQQCDALLMPTLLESFSGTYVEAMYHKKTIYTSNLDFAKDVCGDTAIYFNPLDSKDIFNKIFKNFLNKEIITELKEKSILRLNNMNNWDKTFNQFQKLLSNGI